MKADRRLAGTGPTLDEDAALKRGANDDVLFYWIVATMSRIVPVRPRPTSASKGSGT